MCSWPTKSSSLSGRILSASGRVASVAESSGDASNRLTGWPIHSCGRMVRACVSGCCSSRHQDIGHYKYRPCPDLRVARLLRPGYDVPAPDLIERKPPLDWLEKRAGHKLPAIRLRAPRQLAVAPHLDPKSLALRKHPVSE